MSDGHRQRVAPSENALGTQNVDTQQVAVRSIAWLDLLVTNYN
jgi:hypothetical protein